MMSFSSESSSTFGTSSSSVGPCTTFAEPPFTFLEEEEEDEGDFQSAFFNFFVHPAPHWAREVKSFMSFEDTLR